MFEFLKKFKRKKESSVFEDIVQDLSSEENIESERYYLAYGSNLNKEQMLYRCPSSELVGTGFLENYRLVFRRKRYPCLTLDKEEGYRVPVAIWKVTIEDEENLDRYEGYPYSYLKYETDITVNETNESLKSFFYIMNGDEKLYAPSKEYWNRCYQGYKDCNIDLSYLQEALEYSKAHEGE